MKIQLLSFIEGLGKQIIDKFLILNGYRPKYDKKWVNPPYPYNKPSVTLFDIVFRISYIAGILLYLIYMNTIILYPLNINLNNGNLIVDNNLEHVTKLSKNWYRLFDISQTKYQIKPFELKSKILPIKADLDAIRIDLGVFTEFTMMSNIEPDEKTYSSIVFTDKDKIQQIKEKGLDFLAEYPDNRNVQEIRMIVFSALLAFFIQDTIIKIKEFLKSPYNKKWSVARSIEKIEKKVEA